MTGGDLQDNGSFPPVFSINFAKFGNKTPPNSVIQKETFIFALLKHCKDYGELKTENSGQNPEIQDFRKLQPIPIIATYPHAQTVKKY